MGKTNLIMHEDLKNTIIEMQLHNCDDARYHANYMGGLIKQLLLGCAITPADDKERLDMMQELAFVQTVFESFIPPTADDEDK